MVIDWQGKAIKTKSVHTGIVRVGDFILVCGELAKVEEAIDRSFERMIVQKRNGELVEMQNSSRLEINRKTR